MGTLSMYGILKKSLKSLTKGFTRGKAMLEAPNDDFDAPSTRTLQSGLPDHAKRFCSHFDRDDSCRIRLLIGVVLLGDTSSYWARQRHIVMTRSRFSRGHRPVNMVMSLHGETMGGAGGRL